MKLEVETEDQTTIQCATCKALISDTGKFCPDCGASQSHRQGTRSETQHQSVAPPEPSKRSVDTVMRILLSVAVIFLGTIASLLALQTFNHPPEAEQEQPSTAMGTPIGFDALWDKAFIPGQSGIRPGMEIGKRYQVTAAVNDDLTMLSSATSIYDHNAIYGDNGLDDVSQYESFLQEHKESEEANLLLVCDVVVSMGSNHKFRFHRVDGCHSASRLTY